MLYDIVDCLDSHAIHRDEQKFDVFRIFEIMYPVLESITGPYGDPIPMLECFISNVLFCVSYSYSICLRLANFVCVIQLFQE